MRARLSTAPCLVLLVATLSAQSADRLVQAFTDAIRAYQRGNVESATGALTGWSPRDLQRVDQAVIASRDRPLISAGAMVHTELALLGTLDRREATVTMHLGLAESLVQALPPAQSAEFRRHWYTLAASLLFANTSPEGARPFVGRGLRQFPNDAALHRMAGIIEETLAHFEDPECTGPGCDARGPRSRARPMLTRAESEYRRALELDAQLVDARLRLGRVLFLANQLPRARDELSAAARQADDAQTGYLAHLFLGGLADHEGDFAIAAREYETALRLAPEHPTPRGL